MKVPEDVVCCALEQVLEKMYYCQASGAGPGFVKWPAIGARVTVSGEICGELRVAASTGLALRLAADFVAADMAEVTDIQAAEVVQEFANVVCGAILGAWMPRASVEFSVPSGLAGIEVRDPWPHRFRVESADPELAVDLVLTGP